jgi:lipid-binding SYLF domain-containing protein
MFVISFSFQRYNELRRVLAEGMDSTQPAFLSPTTASNRGGGTGAQGHWPGPPIPSTINVCSSNDDRDYLRPSSPFRGESPRPVVFVFRRTRQRRAPYFSILPSFRIDDECDFASSLVKRLAPTADMDFPIPDAWDEFVHDGTDWLLGNGSILPPKNGRAPSRVDEFAGNDSSIPMDDFERERSKKLASLRSRMAAEALAVDRTDDVEAATIRGMIQKAVGLAFVRASKVVLGVSFHGGSGIVIARLSDGTWSAPSAIGTWGLGLGLQFGLEVADYIFILQTQESLDHFMRGGSFTVGGNIGAAVAGMGREAYGAASVGGICGSETTVKEDEYNDQSSDERQRNPSLGIAPIVAYAKSQGLYVGVSLEGSRIFTRDDINCRTYKFSSGKNVSAYDILSGKVPTPPEAEDLYAALHSVEFTHEMSCLPRPPEILRKDSPNSWYFDRNTLGEAADTSPKRAPSSSGKESPFTFLSGMGADHVEECTAFETQFKKFMYGGVSVQRLIPNAESRSGRTRRERRTLWLMLPEVGSLRLGFVSKLSDEEGAVSNKSSTQRIRRDESDSRIMDGDVGTVASEEVTLDSALLEKVRRCVGGIHADEFTVFGMRQALKPEISFGSVSLQKHRIMLQRWARSVRAM